MLDLGELVTVRTHERDRGVLQVVGESGREVSQLVGQVQDALAGSTWTVVQVDDEGFESELYLSGRRGELAIVKLRETECAERTDVRITVDLGR